MCHLPLVTFTVVKCQGLPGHSFQMTSCTKPWWHDHFLKNRLVELKVRSLCVCHTGSQTHTWPTTLRRNLPVSIAQGIQSVFSGHVAWWDVGDHAGFGIANERVFQDLSETKGGPMKSTNKGHIHYLLCARHWAIVPLTTKRQFTKEETNNQ